MIEYHPIGDSAGYCWLDRRCSDSVSIISSSLHDSDYAAVTYIPNHDRQQASLLGRGLLRYLAMQILRTGSIGIGKTGNGRPYIQDDTGRYIAFASISHSHDMIAVAVDIYDPIGIDVELCRAGRDYYRIAERIFTPAVAERIQSAADFYRAWCLYEAWGKANELEHINPARNTELMKLLEDYLSGTNSKSLQGNGIMFFNPADDYSGCVFSAAQITGGVHAGKEMAL